MHSICIEVLDTVKHLGSVWSEAAQHRATVSAEQSHIWAETMKHISTSCADVITEIASNIAVVVKLCIFAVALVCIVSKLMAQQDESHLRLQ